MSLFKVPGWTAPNDPVVETKKRRRPTRVAPQEDEAQLFAAARDNVENIMRQLAAADARLEATQKKKRKHGESEDVEAEVEADTPKKKNKAGKRKDAAKETQGGKRDSRKESKDKQKDEGGKSNNVNSNNPRVHSDGGKASSAQPSSPGTSKKTGKKAKKGTETTTTSTDAPKPAPSLSKPVPPVGMTELQAKMKQKLDGARFRQINEELYKSDSVHAHDMMKQDPNIFHEYHNGFRHQVESWPTNPVSHYIDTLSTYEPHTVIADLGCGDAALARALVPKGMTVLSYDLVSDGAFVVEADMCGTLPLPGSEGEDSEATYGYAGIVDVVVCALSLMGTNWPNTIREAWRVLKRGGELKIAEVASRFTNMDEFVALVSGFGFKLTSRDTTNTHFTLLEFRKRERQIGARKDFKALLGKGDLLKPCEYKRR